MDRFLFLVLFIFTLAIPVNAAYSDGGVIVDGITESSDPAAPAPEAVAESMVSSEEGEAGITVLAGSDLFAGGYWFVCDCSLGYDLTFYIPVDWADGQFTLSSSGAPVNMSNSTVYAYCPNFPDYTFSCSRFSEFTYRASNYNTSDLNITRISDTNIDFLENEVRRLSDYELNILSCCLIFLVAAILIIKRS